MGNIISKHDVFNVSDSRKQLQDETYNCRVALWHLPYDSRFSKYDTDGSKWFESINQNLDNEIENVENKLKISLSRYKTYTQTLKYTDGSVTENSVYPNGNRVKVTKTPDYVIVNIKDKTGEIIAEKVYNYCSNEGRKTIYKHYTQGDDKFTVVRVFSYDTTKNKSSDIVNFGYTSLESKLTNGCRLEKEYYMLNGNEVKATLTDDFKYHVQDKQGRKLTFLAK